MCYDAFMVRLHIASVVRCGTVTGVVRLDSGAVLRVPVHKAVPNTWIVLDGDLDPMLEDIPRDMLFKRGPRDREPKMLSSWLY